MGAERQSAYAAIARFVSWWLRWILFMLFQLALVNKLCILISANLHDANVIDVVNATFVWAYD
jgi:hypothetical protein